MKTRKPLAASALTALCCGIFSFSCQSQQAVLSAPAAPAASADRIAQRAAVKLGDDPIYGYDAWPGIPQTLADGDGRQLTESVCSACHSTAYIIGQPPLNEAAWKAEVAKMIEAYGAAVPEGGTETIVAYLTANYGPDRKAKFVAAQGTNDTGAAAKFPRGEQVYQTHCVACHQVLGTGVPGAFPPLAGHVPELLATDKGRTYLPQVVLYGLQGEVTVKGTKYNNVMTPFPQLSDEDLAQVLNHVATAWGNAQALGHFTPFMAGDVAAQRGQGGSAQKTHAARP